MREEKEHVVTVVTTRLVKSSEERILNLFLSIMAIISLSTGMSFLVKMPFDLFWSLLFAAPFFAGSMFLLSWCSRGPKCLS